MLGDDVAGAILGERDGAVEKGLTLGIFDGAVECGPALGDTECGLVLGERDGSIECGLLLGVFEGAAECGLLLGAVVPPGPERNGERQRQRTRFSTEHSTLSEPSVG